jgi:hypothetical protein
VYTFICISRCGERGLCNSSVVVWGKTKIYKTEEIFKDLWIAENGGFPIRVNTAFEISLYLCNLPLKL